MFIHRRQCGLGLKARPEIEPRRRMEVFDA